jgi:SAM-dependent methyltransferase
LRSTEGFTAAVGRLRSGEAFDEEYYRTGLGPLPYERSNIELVHFFCAIADQLIRALHPKTVLDAGCAMGFLVEAFWDRGIETHGIDISSYAISQVRRDMAPFCRVASLTAPIDRRYDLITCIEVLEHMPDDQARLSIQNLAAATDTILFSSSPYDLTEPTHINVKQPIAWLEMFASGGFYPDLMFDASFVAPQAMLLRRTDRVLDWDVLRLFSELIRYKNAVIDRDRNTGQLDIAKTRDKLRTAEEKLISLASEMEQRANTMDTEIAGQRAALEKVQGELERVTAQNAVLVEELENSSSAREGFQHESQRRLAQCESEIAAFRKKITANIEDRLSAANGELQAVQRKVSALELTSLESRRQLTEILQSRIWRGLKGLGGVILRFAPGKR